VKIALKSRETALFGVLAVVGGVALYSNFSSDTPPAPVQPKTIATAAAPAPPPPVHRRGTTSRAAEFIPRLGSLRPEDRIDPTKVDPTLRLDLLAKVQGVPFEGGARNIFVFGPAAPPPPPPGSLPKVTKLDMNSPGAPLTPPPPTGAPSAAPPPPIPFKYYGFSSMKGEERKRAFFLDGEDIIVAWEGDLIKNRYRVIRVGINSVEMEDTQFKNKQSLPLAEETVA
jgi:hypothetical protein